MYRLIRTSDGAGDSGNVSRAYKIRSDGLDIEKVGDAPTLGARVMVGHANGKGYSPHSKWVTAEVTGIVEDVAKHDGRYIKFKTQDSEYEWIAGKDPRNEGDI